MFSTHDIPDVLVSDNGAKLTSTEFCNFLKINAIRQVLIAPYNSPGNGQVERMIETPKESLKGMQPGNWKKCIANLLLRQHITPSSSTGFAPSEFLMKRRLKTYLRSHESKLCH